MLAMVLALSILSAPSETDLALDVLAACPALGDEACLVAAARLKVAGEAALEPLAKRVDQFTTAGQLLALSVVADHANPTTNAMLAKLAADKNADPTVRALAIDARGKRRDKLSTQLATRLLKDKEALVRQAAVRVLANTVSAKDKATIAALTQASKDPSPAVRADAAFGLGFCGCTEAGPVLAAKLGDSDLAVRRAAAEGLCFVKHEPAVRALIEALKSDDELLVHGAARALAFQTEQPFGADAVAWEQWLATKP